MPTTDLDNVARRLVIKDIQSGHDLIDVFKQLSQIDDDFNGNYAVVNMGAQSHLFGLSTYDCGGDFYSSYTSSTFFSKKIAWNDGSQLNYSFSVIAQDDASITLRFYKNF